jgi:hypothetical protein
MKTQNYIAYNGRAADTAMCHALQLLKELEEVE